MVRTCGMAVVVMIGLVAGCIDLEPSDNCVPVDVWTGTPERDVRLVRSGERLLVVTGTRSLVVGPGDVIEADHPRPPALTLDDPIVGVDGGFWQRHRLSTGMTLDRLGLDGLPTGERVVLTATSGPFPIVDARGPLVAAAWADDRDVHQFQDLHLMLLRADGTVIASPVVPARYATLVVAPVIGDRVVWLVWNEAPELVMVGMRFDAADGHPLDTSPIPISQAVSPAYALGVAPVRVGATLRLYVTLTNGTQVVTLADDGTVTALPPTAATGYLVGSPGGHLFEVAAANSARLAFPQPGTIAIAREQAAGELAPLVSLPGVVAEAVGVADGLAVATAVDTASGDTGTSAVVLQRLDATGAVLHSTVLAQAAQTRSDGWFCDE